MSNFPLLLDKMDNRVIHDIVAIIVLIEVIIVTVYYLWSHHHHHQWVATEITAWTTNGVSSYFRLDSVRPKPPSLFRQLVLHCCTVLCKKFLVALCKVPLVTVLVYCSCTVFVLFLFLYCSCAALYCVLCKKTLFLVALCKVALVTVLHTLHPVQFTMRFSEGSLCHKLRPAVKIRWENGGRGGSRSCEGGGVEHYEHYGWFGFLISNNNAYEWSARLNIMNLIADSDFLFRSRVLDIKFWERKSGSRLGGSKNGNGQGA